MSELHAALALEALSDVDVKIARRRELGRRYCRHLDEIPGLRSQAIDDGDETTYKAYSIVVEPEYGVERDALVDALQAEGIETRRYFWPPVHRATAVRLVRWSRICRCRHDLASRVVTLPIWPAMSDADVDTIADVLMSIHRCAGRDGVPAGRRDHQQWQMRRRSVGT